MPQLCTSRTTHSTVRASGPRCLKSSIGATWPHGHAWLVLLEVVELGKVSELVVAAVENLARCEQLHHATLPDVKNVVWCHAVQINKTVAAATSDIRICERRSKDEKRRSEEHTTTAGHRTADTWRLLVVLLVVAARRK